MSRILLVRHGRSALQHDGRWMPAARVGDYEDAYDAAGIRDDDVPPPDLLDVAQRAHVIAASDLPRAIASARRLAPDRDPLVSPLLREIRLEPPGWVPFRLPIEAWDAFSHLQWSYRLFSQADHDFVRRASAAADWLVERSSDASTVLAVTHGGFRRILDARLVARGAHRIPGVRRYENWSTWSYTL